jgi:signal peptidase I
VRYETYLSIGSALTLIVGGAAILVVRTRLIAVTVIGASMEPALRSGDRVLVRRARPAAIRAGDVVVVRQLDHYLPGFGREPDGMDDVTGSLDEGRGIQIRADFERSVRARGWAIKRVAAVPGERVPSGLEPALSHLVGKPVPPDQLVLLGDNRNASVDSRRYGFIPAEHLLGIVVRRIGPSPSTNRSHSTA